MRAAFLTTVAIIVLLVGALAIVRSPDRWPPVEVPPRQGEALDRTAYRQQSTAHSADALSRLIREPQNTWSNLAFVAGGAFLLWSKGASRSARLLGVVLIGVGIGSFLYHASASRALRHLDVGAMYWLFFLASLFSLGSMIPRFKFWIEKHEIILGIITLVPATVGTAFRNVTFAGVKPGSLNVLISIAVALLLGALLLTAFRRRTCRAVMECITALMTFTAALVCQIGDRPGSFLCDPAALIQGHALWHVLSALAFVVAVKTVDSPPPTSPGGQPRTLVVDRLCAARTTKVRG